MVPPQRGGGVPTPARQLLDFERVHVAKGATAFVSFSITASQLQLVRARASDLSSPFHRASLRNIGVASNDNMTAVLCYWSRLT